MEKTFVRSSYSGVENCVEACPPEELVFRASSWSGGNGGNCLEAAEGAHCVVVRDSKLLEYNNPLVHFGPEAFTAFVGGLAVDEFAHM